MSIEVMNQPSFTVGESIIFLILLGGWCWAIFFAICFVIKLIFGEQDEH